jgi:dipeptidyl aminopeptidase/acylaminoacyl peptidase
MLLPGSPEARSLDIDDADVLAVRAGELALSIRRRYVGGERFAGTLAVVPILGGAPREVLDDVEEADWDAASGDFAVVRSKGYGAPAWIEYPPGRILHQSSGSIHGIRISRDGRLVAFVEDPAGIGSGGRLRVVDREGKERALTGEWARARGVAWSPSGREVWFTAAAGRDNRTLHAVDLDGRERSLLEGAGSLTVWDAADDGRVLLSRDDDRMSVV